MDEIYEITEYVQDEAGEDTDLIWGNCFDETLGEKICVTVIATGFEGNKSGREIVSPKKEQIVVSLEDDRPKDKGVYDTGYREGEYTQSFDLDLDKQKRSYGSHVKAHGDPYLKAQDRQDHEQGQAGHNKEEFRQKNKRLNNPQAVIDLENEPAYLRRRVELDDVPHSSEVTASRWSISGDDEPQIRKDSPYLHDNVD